MEASAGGGGAAGTSERDASSAGDASGVLSSARPARVGAMVDASAASARAMPPPAPRPARKRAEVLDEDEWTARLEGIITRDYFPDIPKLKDKLEWLEATRSGDPARVRAAQANIQRRQRERLGTPGGALSTPSLGGSGGTGSTPSPMIRGGAARATGLRSEPATPRSMGGSEWGDDDDDDDRDDDRDHDDRARGAVGDRDATAATTTANADSKLSLDGFLNKYTSEDNASFAEALERANAAKRARYAWQQQETHDEEQKQTRSSSASADVKALPSASTTVTDGSGTEDGVDRALTFHPFRAKNDLYYVNDGVALSVAEASRRAQGPPKETVARNTRFVMQPRAPAPTPTPTRGAIVDPGARVAMETAAAGGGRVRDARGYEIVRTPDVAPDPEELAFTWGEIASTPILLDAEETPVDIGGWGGVGGTPGSRFKVNRTPARDEVLRGLTHGGGGFGRAGKASPSPARNPGGNRTPALGGGFDAALRGSYSGRIQTPSRRAPGGGSGRATPVVGGTPVRGTPSRLRDGGARQTRNSLTDDLLDV